jgi:predicted AAA+ superfamily ATPase
MLKTMIERMSEIVAVERSLQRNPITAILGPRQCGKTTLARQVSARYSERAGNAIFFDCESVPDQRRLANPELVLGSLQGLVVIDEIQLIPELFSALRVLADRENRKAVFLILGSASPPLSKAVSESLAGRTEIVELSGFSLEELGPQHWRKLWVRGGFPRSFLAESDDDSEAWRDGFIRTFLERDIPLLGIRIPAAAMRRFWTMLAHFHGQTWNASELSRSMGLSDKSVRSYLDLLTGTFMIRQLQPWHENLGKRQVKAPKIYFRDTGLLHLLLGLPNESTLLGHPRVGASWEGFAAEEVLRVLSPSQAWFWSVHAGAELDLFVIIRGERWGFEFKFSEAPTITASMRTAQTDLALDQLFVVYPGSVRYPAGEGIHVLPLTEIGSLRTDRSPD